MHTIHTVEDASIGTDYTNDVQSMERRHIPVNGPGRYTPRGSFSSPLLHAWLLHVNAHAACHHHNNARSPCTYLRAIPQLPAVVPICDLRVTAASRSVAPSEYEGYLVCGISSAIHSCFTKYPRAHDLLRSFATMVAHRSFRTR
jgi:hypothetical protein